VGATRLDLDRIRAARRVITTESIDTIADGVVTSSVAAAWT
jgi:hypothetical protein